ncbi:hypothetical protein SODALDRAFT_379295 [Sodiomyces alkalinus F11]|uniref:Uncharacterized protein n=1 Tax=Sodiomyces alkalinus (strain CBS 110278 / VKM F-3762 / F11) TaxID=1314773 RepID=A0A3N2PU71_SODAK|nr:hypothetical protein SODALDRAFT_379295 [Sodiomyces alkalinus F11]ROT38068.1 hypothetical protein SODALDRAFT_379295 [Sodiomyces alkalinus F11]
MYIPPQVPPQPGAWAARGPVGPTETPRVPSHSPVHAAAAAADILTRAAVGAVSLIHASFAGQQHDPPTTLTRRQSNPNQTNVTVGIVIGIVLAIFIIGACTFLYIYRGALRKLHKRRQRRRRRRHKALPTRFLLLTILRRPPRKGEMPLQPMPETSCALRRNSNLLANLSPTPAKRTFGFLLVSEHSSRGVGVSLISGPRPTVHISFATTPRPFALTTSDLELIDTCILFKPLRAASKHFLICVYPFFLLRPTLTTDSILTCFHFSRQARPVLTFDVSALLPPGQTSFEYILHQRLTITVENVHKKDDPICHILSPCKSNHLFCKAGATGRFEFRAHTLIDEANVAHPLSRRNVDRGAVGGIVVGCLILGVLLLAVAGSCFQHDCDCSSRPPSSSGAAGHKIKNHRLGGENHYHGRYQLPSKPRHVRTRKHRRRTGTRQERTTVRVPFLDVLPVDHPTPSTIPSRHPEIIVVNEPEPSLAHPHPLEETIHVRDFAAEPTIGEETLHVDDVAPTASGGYVLVDAVQPPELMIPWPAPKEHRPKVRQKKKDRGGGCCFELCDLLCGPSKKKKTKKKKRRSVKEKLVEEDSMSGSREYFSSMDHDKT